MSEIFNDLVAAVSLAAVLGVSFDAQAAESPWTNSNRIAITADGNPDADADDVGATPFSLAVLAKAGFQKNLAHYDFNNFLEYKPIPPNQNRIWLGAFGGQARWGFDRENFFDAVQDPDGAVKHLAKEINKSTAQDPLYLILAGPLELTYRALELANPDSRKHLIMVSHHNYNEYFKPRLWQRNIDDIRKLCPEIGYIKIKDQNGWNNNGLKGNSIADFDWLKNHADENLNWVYDRVKAGKPDVSDAGMLSWLIGINGADESVNLAEMKDWFGPEKVPTNGGIVSKVLPPPETVTPKVVPPNPDQIFQEVDGKIIIEAESVPLTDDWMIEKTEPDFSGNGYIRWMSKASEKISHQHRGVLLYKLRITNPGKYRMALRASHKGAPKRDEWNDCFTVMGLNPVSPFGITRKTYHNVTNDQFFNDKIGFSWGTTHNNYGSMKHKGGEFSKPIYDLQKGDHYFWICGRSRGYRLDKIHFFKEGVDGFTNDSEPVTPIIKVGE